MIDVHASVDNRALVPPTESFDLLRMDRKIERRVRLARYARLTSWAALVVFGLRRRGLFGFALAAVGVTQLGRALADRVELWPKPKGPALRQLESRSTDAAIDHASWASFPASDPPS